MLGVTFRSDAGYLIKHVEEHQSTERGNYYLSAAEHGEPPGQWRGAGAARLGLAGDVEHGEMIKLYNDLADPATGEQLGRRPYRFADISERLAEAIAAEGGEVLPERRQELALALSRKHREARHYADCTFSPPKSWSVYHAALERAGRLEEAEQVWAALMEGVDAGIEYLQEHAGYSRAGRHGIEVADRTAGRWVEGKDWIVSTWRHHTSRDGDPQLHVHAAVLNRVRCESDGKWRTLDSRAISRARVGAGAVAERVAEEALTRRLGVEFALRPDGRAREIVGIDESARDLFSSRRRAITAELAERVAAYEQAYGHAPNVYTLRLMSEQATLKTRARKPDHPPTRDELLASWEERARETLGQSLDQVAEQVQLEPDRASESFLPESVISRAIASLEGSKSVWTRHDLVAAINRELPDCLGGLPARRVLAVVDELAAQALAPGGQVVLLTAPELVPAPPELRRADGRSIYEPPTAERYATVRQLQMEEQLLAAARRVDGPRVEPERVEQLLQSGTLSEPQAAAVREMLSSGRNLETFIGAPGTGKSFAAAELARLWQEATGAPVIGLATAERARLVLAEEGVGQTANISRWLLEQERLPGQLAEARRLQADLLAQAAVGPLSPAQSQMLGEVALRLAELEAGTLRAGQLIIVDESSMVTTRDHYEILRRAEAAGAKVVLSGDDRQLGAVGAGGLFRLLAQEPAAQRLEETRRFEQEWERTASLRLRAGEVEVLADYDRHGRLLDGTRADMLAAARDAFVADHLSDRQSLLVVPTNELAAELSSAVRIRLVELGWVAETGVTLSDGNVAGVGDLVVTRLNDRTVAGGGVVNREVYQVQSVGSDGSLCGLKLDGYGHPGGEARTLPAAYVAGSVELGYAATAHSAQGRTVERSYTVLDDQANRETFLVGMTRGKQLNAAYVITEDPDRELAEERQNVIAVLAGVIERDGSERSATEVLRQELAGVESLARLEPQWADVVSAGNVSRYQEELQRHLSSGQYERLVADDSLTSVYASLRAHELAGRAPGEVLRQVTADELGSAKSVGSVLTWRLEHQVAGTAEPAASFSARTPAREDAAGVWAQELAAAMDRRVAELGEQAASETPSWLQNLGMPPADPNERATWTARAGAVAAYREAYGYLSPIDAIGAAPPRGAVEARASWERAYEALGRPEQHRDIAASTDAELERIQSVWEVEQLWAPAHVDDELRQASLGVRHWETQAALDRAKLSQLPAEERDEVRRLVEEKDRLAGRIADRVSQLEEVVEARGAWYAATQESRTPGLNWPNVSSAAVGVAKSRRHR